MKLRPLAMAWTLLGVVIAGPINAQAPKPDSKTLAATGILERLAERSGVYGVPPTAKVPGFIADAGWPQKLPNNWIIGQVGGLYVAPDDHIWIYQRPRSLTTDEAALTGATNRSKDGKPVDVLGFARPYGVLGDCCKPAPSVMEFDASGKMLRAWGGPADPDRCKVAQGCVWPATEHGRTQSPGSQATSERFRCGSSSASRSRVSCPAAWSTALTSVSASDSLSAEF